MKYVIDLFAILLMGDGLAKLLSSRAHNRFYRFAWAPGAYNDGLEKLCQSPALNMIVALAMILTGAVISMRVEGNEAHP